MYFQKLNKIKLLAVASLLLGCSAIYPAARARVVFVGDIKREFQKIANELEIFQYLSVAAFAKGDKERHAYWENRLNMAIDRYECLKARHEK